MKHNKQITSWLALFPQLTATRYINIIHSEKFYVHQIKKKKMMALSSHPINLVRNSKQVL